MNTMSNSEFIEIYEKNIDTIYQVCYMFMKNKHDTEDAVQTTFLKLFKSNMKFETEEHAKAWLIVTASNTCKNNLKYWFKKQVTSLIEEIPVTKKEDNTLNIILKLPEKYKLIFYMYYYQGYKTKEIAEILNINESTIRSHLHRGRDYLKEIIKEGF